MKITKTEFLERINKVSEDNKLVKTLLDEVGYAKFPAHLKAELHELAGVKVTVITEYSTVD